MVFSSTVFLCAFLPIFLWLYALAPRRCKNLVLLLASILFYGWGAPRFLFVLIGLAAVTYYLVAFMERASSPIWRRGLLAIAISVNVGLLFYFKYLNFFLESLYKLIGFLGASPPFELAELVLPIGISFYTFETVTYVVDVYRGVHRPLNRFWKYLLYILMFPKLIAGPIVRFHEIADQFSNRFDRSSGGDRLVGLHRFCLGLGKKVLIANVLGVVVDSIYGDAKTGAGGRLVTRGASVSIRRRCPHLRCVASWDLLLLSAWHGMLHVLGQHVQLRERPLPIPQGLLTLV